MKMILLVLIAVWPLPEAGAQSSAASSNEHLLRIVRHEVRPSKARLQRAVAVKQREAFESVRWPVPYKTWFVASGQPEMWFVSTFDSYGSWSRDEQQQDLSRELRDALDTIERTHGDIVARTTTILATLRADLSFQPAPVLANEGAVSITIVRTKPGHAADYAAERRIIKDAHEKAGTKERYSVYQVSSGLPAGTFLLVIPYKNLGELDDVPTIHGAPYEAALGDEGRTRSRELIASATVDSETLLLVVDPHASYAAQARK